MPLTLRSFATVRDAGAALQDAEARYLGGGTLVIRQVNEGDVSFSTLVRATAPALTRIDIAGGTARLGAGVTMAAIACHPDLAFLARAPRTVGGPAIRNMATVGGNLFAPAPFGDLAVALLALDATVAVAGQEVPLAAFLAGRDGAYARSIVTGVRFALPPEGSFRFVKASRTRPRGAAVVTIAAMIEEAGGGIRAARIALGGMADRAMRAAAAERALLGRPRTADGIAPALEVACQGTAPLTDAIASAWYRSEVLPVHLGRLLLA